MRAEDRQRLFDRLMQGAAEQCGGDRVALRIFEESTNEDLDAIEPIILEIEKQAEERGRLEAGLEVRK